MIWGVSTTIILRYHWAEKFVFQVGPLKNCIEEKLEILYKVWQRSKLENHDSLS